MSRQLALALAAVLACSGCGSPDEPAPGASSGGSGGSTGTGAASGQGGGGVDSGAGASGGSPADAAAGGQAGSAGSAPIADPTQPGPFAMTAFDATATVTSTSHQVPMHCLVPDAPGPHPIVIIAHGFQLPASQYYGYAERLASFGYVACTADYPAGFSPNHAQSAQDLVGALDWAIAAAAAAGNPLTAKVDATLAGVMGHSLGGKLSVLAAAQEPRFKAVLGLDPVDSAMLCDETACPDASSKLPLPIPTAFLGETLDATAGLGGQACAPAADNYQTFYAQAGSPSYELTFNGANHMSFIDDPAGCGIVCSFCKPATLAHAEAIGMARAVSVAFFERWLRGRADYESYLTGAAANAFWIGTGRLSVASK